MKRNLHLSEHEDNYCIVFAVDCFDNLFQLISFIKNINFAHCTKPELYYYLPS